MFPSAKAALPYCLANIFMFFFVMNYCTYMQIQITTPLISHISLQHQIPSYTPIPNFRVFIENVHSEVLLNGSVEVIHQTPTKCLPRGIFFIAHACTHSARDFWNRSHSCKNCTGLSEEVRIVRYALSKCYVVVAISSSDRVTGCWGQADNYRVRESLKIIARRYHRAAVTPWNVISFGASSGGSFVWGQVQRGEVDGAIIQIMALDVTRGHLKRIPMVLSSMPRDHLTSKAMAQNANVLNNRQAEHVLYQQCKPLPVSVEYLVERVDNMDEHLANFIMSALYKYNHVNISTQIENKSAVSTTGYRRPGLSGYLIKDPTQSDWRDALHREAALLSPDESILKDVVLTKGKSPLAKALHRAWAFHEYCSDNIAENIDWLESKIVSSSSSSFNA